MLKIDWTKIEQSKYAKSEYFGTLERKEQEAVIKLYNQVSEKKRGSQSRAFEKGARRIVGTAFESDYYFGIQLDLANMKRQELI